ncbi:MAG TPA: cyclic pyranopterin monophosphate synthase MoaC [Longimicrobiales bacterium]|nr:cyclic pyranopterin monophosphate synthase MoaC [Longimicrobiales bacterium]
MDSNAEARKLTHLDARGRATMVDVGDKEATTRVAVAEGVIRMAPETLLLLREGRTPKGDPLLVAQVAGIQAAKRTWELIPMCHPLPLSSVDVLLESDPDIPGVRATGTARVTGPTGVEMEALTSVSVALLTVYDMLKAVDRKMQIGTVRLLQKSGGRSGDWSAETSEEDPHG